MISLWENLVLLTKMKGIGISDDFRHVLTVINFWRGLQGALWILNGPKWTTQCVVNIQNKIFHYGMISLWKKLQRSWEKEYLLILGIFWSFLRLCGIPQGPQGSPRWKTVCHEKLRLNILLWDDFTLKKMCVTHIEGGQMTKENDLRHVLAIFKLWGPSQGPLKVPNCSRWTT